ncbi:MAG: hypothetical protein C4581_00510 [Nitrospiraceae bacterium]|nr:MAG: hypothetical protein C4581_00510 [Nitrospiraceae bacterium]
MKRSDIVTVFTASTELRRHISKGIAVLLLTIIFGCATAPVPLTIRHEKTPPRSEADRSDQQRREDGSAPAGEKDGGPAASQLSEQEMIDRISAAVTAELMQKLKEQIMAQVREELSRELQDREKEQIGKITASVTEEIRKSIPEQLKTEAQEALPKEIKTADAVPAAEEASAQEKEKIAELNQKVSYVEQKIAELLYGGKVAELAAAAPEWTKRVRFSGDVRLRYENDRYDENNFDEFTRISQGADTQELINTRSNQYRFKYRVRFGTELDISEDPLGTQKLQAALRLATGNSSNPVSTNTLLGDYMNKDGIVLEQAYLKFNQKSPGYLPTLFTAYGGRMPNPWFSSDLVWDSDLNFEGLALNLRKPITDSWTFYLTEGAFPLQYDDFSTKAKWLTGGQIGMEKKHKKGISAKVGAAYYLFSNITGVRNNNSLDKSGPTDWSAPQYQQKGNTLFYIDPNNSFKVGLASKFKEMNLTGTLDIGFWDPVHVVFLGDFVKNYGFDKSEVSDLTGLADPEKDITGYQFGMSVDSPAIETPDDWVPSWKAYLYYKYLGGDAVVDAFTDSDFHLGGTNARGWILGAEYGLMKNAWLTLRWLTADEISGPKQAIDVLQVDLNARF